MEKSSVPSKMVPPVMSVAFTTGCCTTETATEAMLSGAASGAPVCAKAVASRVRAPSQPQAPDRRARGAWARTITPSKTSSSNSSSSAAKAAALRAGGAAWAAAAALAAGGGGGGGGGMSPCAAS